MKIKAWIEAMRLRTLPVSLAGVITGIAYAVISGSFRAAPALLCLLYALLCQIASNFANEYFDYRDGLDRPGREGPRRGVTEGDITPRAMLAATWLTVGAACIIGLSLLLYAPLWLIAVGIAVAVGVMAYSAGPWPLSRHCMGEVAVLFFFGIIPVNFTFFVQSGYFSLPVLLGSVSIGLMGADVLIVNNYRDADADAAVGKHTLATALGRPFCAALYLANGLVALVLMLPQWWDLGAATLIIPILWSGVHILLWKRLRTHSGQALNPLLGMTAVAMGAYALLFLLCAIY